MATLTAGGNSSATLVLDAFASVTVVADGSCNGTLSFVSDAQNLLSNKTAKVQNKTYGPYGVPGTVTISITAGSLTYTVNGNTGGFDYDASGNITGLVGAGGTIYGIGASYTWATLPVASTMSGVVVFVSDIGGGTYWRSNGTNWKPLNGRYTHYKPTARQTSAVAAETLLDRVLFPAGLLRTGFVIMNRVTTSKSSTAETATLRFKFGTLGTTGDTQLYTSTNLATTNVSGGVLADFKVASATTIQKIGSASTTTAWNGPNTSAFPAAITVSDVSANACYLDITVQKDAGVETFALEDWVCEVLAPTV